MKAVKARLIISPRPVAQRVHTFLDIDRSPLSVFLPIDIQTPGTAISCRKKLSSVSLPSSRRARAPLRFLRLAFFATPQPFQERQNAAHNRNRYEGIDNVIEYGRIEESQDMFAKIQRQQRLNIKSEQTPGKYCQVEFRP
jgi:hypothetical protein